ARIALEACPDGRWVIGNLGPTGSAPPEAGVIEGACEEQAGLLEEGGVHVLHIETLGGRVEALAALRGARAGSSLPILVSVTLRADEKSFLTLAGDDPLDVWRALQEGGADAVGANCLLEGPDLARALRSYRRHISVPFIAQPARQVRGAPTGRFVDSVGDLIRSGANGIGGCCGIDADDIAAAGGIIKEMADGA
ncbi:MAG: homocysteine S-methyltransferase family protein, partial [Planctomycetota bacterium]|nr:homocysteine S-methyltransferase family protein [Planctomycetota bacterium]